MSNVKISQLPAVSSVLTTDVIPAVASSATSQITIQNLANSLPSVSSASFASTASYFVTSSVTNASTASCVNRLNQNLVVSGSLLMSGSIIPNVGSSFTSSFDLGSSTAAWRDLYIANGTIYFTDPANNQKTTLSVISGSLVNSGSGQINSGSIIHKSAVGTLTVRTDQLSGADSVTGSFRYLPEGYQAYNLYNNFNYNGESIIYLYQLCRSSGSAVAKNPITTSPIRIVNRSGYSPIVLKPYVDDSSVGFKSGQGSAESSSFYLLTGSYVDLYVETPTATGYASLSWVVVTSGSIL
jgi:hypothetical protein